MINGLRRTDWWVVVTDSLVFIDLRDCCSRPCVHVEVRKCL